MNNYIEILENNKHYFEDFITRMTYHSNAIEGSSMSLDETYALLFDSNHAPINTKIAREIHETENHKKALEYLLKIIKEKKVINSEILIKLCKIIQTNIVEIYGYRLGIMRVKGSTDKFPYPKDLEKLMNEFFDKYNNMILNNGIDFNKLANMHIEYENIHPFQDGNGRTGRLLINYYLLMNDRPPLVIPFEKRSEYLMFIRNKDIAGLASLLESLSIIEEDLIKDYEAMNK